MSLLSSGTLEDFPESRLFTLNEVINSPICYPVFLEFLVGAVSTENLLCVRMIDTFEHLMSKAVGRHHHGSDTALNGSSKPSTGTGPATKTPTAPSDMEAYEAATEQAWETYRFFVTPGASLEVSCHHLLRKHIMLQMGK